MLMLLFSSGLFLSSMKALISLLQICVFRPPNTIPCLVQGIGRVGRSSPFGSRLAGAVVLFNDEDLKENTPGMTNEMRSLLRSSGCLKDHLAGYFGYNYNHDSYWCCSAEI
jgi:hypothetical protein